MINKSFVYGFGTGVLVVWAMHRYVTPMGTTKQA